MYEKALIIILFGYSISFGALVGQYFIGDVLGITLTNYRGAEMKSYFLDFINTASLNTQQESILTQNQTEVEQNPILVGARAAWELITLLTGTYIFNVVYFMLGGDTIGSIDSVDTGAALAVGGMVSLYIFLLIRAVFAYVRGI